MTFDPYLIWLDISPHERPVNYYRLFGLRPLEIDPHIIAAAAQRVISHVSQFQNSPNAVACQQLLSELNAARMCLLDPLRKRAYDAGFTSPGGPERALNSPPVPGAPTATPAWMTNTQATRAPRAGERQIASSPPLPYAAMPSTPVTKPVSFNAPLQLQTPIAPQAYVPPANVASGYASPYVPTSQPLPSTPAYSPPQATPVYPQQPPAWAAAERTGQVGTVAAGEEARSEVLQQPPPRRIFRRQDNNTAVYVVVALAMAMLVFFFGAVVLLALFMAAN